jgi:ubiquinone/menaquinone biosynthesis C-methylase UbiE
VTSENLQWYTNIFNDLNYDWEAIVDQRGTEKEVAFIENVLGKEERRLVLDLCCGTGRHSIVLAQHGWNMIGLDLSKNLLTIAKQRMRQKATDFPIIQADMRYLPFRSRVFKAVVNMFTSFGYLPSEAEDLKCLHAVQRVLMGNGHFLLDVVNKEYVAKIRKERDWAEYEPFYLLENRILDLRKSMLLSEWTIIRKNTNEVRHIQHNLRMYSFAKIKQMLNKASLGIKQVYGGYDKRKFSPCASRMILLAQKREMRQKERKLASVVN